MASTSPVHPLWPISAPCCSALVLFSTMEDNDNRAQQQRTLFISVPLCLSLFFVSLSPADALIWFLSRAPLFLVTYLCPFFSARQTHTSLDRRGGGTWDIKLFKTLNRWTQTCEPPFTSVYLYTLRDQHKDYSSDNFLFILRVKRRSFDYFKCWGQSPKNNIIYSIV